MFGSRSSLEIIALTFLVAFAMLLGQADDVRAQLFDGSGALTSEQRTRIEKHVLAESRPSVAAPIDFSAMAGGTLPLGIELFWMSPAVGLNHYRYAVVEGRTLIVVPYTRRIVAVFD